MQNKINNRKKNGIAKKDIDEQRLKRIEKEIWNITIKTHQSPLILFYKYALQYGCYKKYRRML